MNSTFGTFAGRFVVTAVLGASLAAPYAAHADINIVGSTHGQNYQGVANPTGGQAAASIPLSLCDAGGTPQRFENVKDMVDLTDSSILIPAGNIVVWRCTVGGVPNFLFRYTGGFSAKAYGNIEAQLGDQASMFTSIVPGGTGCTTQGTKTDPGTGRTYESFTVCSQRTLVSADFATSDTWGTAFATNMCDPTGPSGLTCAAPIADSGITTFPITATPFALIVGNGVQKCDAAGTAQGKISLSRQQVEAIFSGQVSKWGQLGYCAFPVVAFNPPFTGAGANSGDMSPIGTAGGDPNADIITCSRPVSAGTRIIFDATQMQQIAELSFGTVGPPFTGDINYLAQTVADGLTCIQGKVSNPVSPTDSLANPNGIAYNRADEAASPVQFGVGNVGRMRGGYPVLLDGTLPSNYIPPATLSAPTDAERAAAQKDFRCGRYTFWSDWVGIQRNVANPNQSLWNSYVAAIGTLLPKTTTGFFWARNVRQPGQSINTEMFITKGAGQTKGPINFESGDHPACR